MERVRRPSFSFSSRTPTVALEPGARRPLAAREIAVVVAVEPVKFAKPLRVIPAVVPTSIIVPAVIVPTIIIVPLVIVAAAVDHAASGAPGFTLRRSSSFGVSGLCAPHTIRP